MTEQHGAESHAPAAFLARKLPHVVGFRPRRGPVTLADAVCTEEMAPRPPQVSADAPLSPTVRACVFIDRDGSLPSGTGRVIPPGIVHHHDPQRRAKGRRLESVGE